MTRFLVVAAAVMAVVTAPLCRAETFYLGGTGTVGTPSAASMAYLINTGIIDDPAPIGLAYPAQLWPLVGTTTLDESVAQGLDTLDEAIRTAKGPVTVVGVSQGAVVINYEKQRLLTETGARDDITFVTIGDPTNSDGGAMSKFPSVHIPVLDFTITPPPVPSPYQTVEVVREFDGVSDFPDRPRHVLATANAIIGGSTIHPYYGGIDIDADDNIVTYSADGLTKHILVPTDTLPLTQWMRDAGVNDKVVDAIDKPLRRAINRAYDGPRPGKPSTPKVKRTSAAKAGAQRRAARHDVTAKRSTDRRAHTAAAA